MENNSAVRRKAKEPATEAEANWSNMPYDILMHILSMLSVLDRIVNAAAVCQSWRAAVSDPIFSRTLDLAICRKLLFPKAHPNGRAILELVFIRGINLGLDKLTKIVFDPAFHVTDKHLIYAASRCRNLEELELPFLYKITAEGLRNTFRFWTQLKTLFVAYNTTITGVNIFGIAGENCPLLTHLRIGCFILNRKMVAGIALSIPRLQKVSVRCSVVMPDAAAALLKILPNLEELYICIRKINFAKYNGDGDIEYVPAAKVLHDPAILSKAAKLKVYKVCYHEDWDWWIAAAMVGRTMVDTSTSSPAVD